MSRFGVSRFRLASKNKCLQFLVCCFGFYNALGIAAPGAHGPDGEHLDTEVHHQSTQNPKFESFTETFELVGELEEGQLVIHLHDYQTNIPVRNAAIEVESGSASAEASFSETNGIYIVTQQGLLDGIKARGEHQIILTVLTEEAADLMEATLIISEDDQDEHHGHDEHGSDEHHHHFPWWAVGLAILCFLSGVYFNKWFYKEVKS